MLSSNIPGTNIQFNEAEDAFTIIRPMIEITGGFSLGQVCKITGLLPSTIQNWVKRKYIPAPVNKKYLERHISRLLLVSVLRDYVEMDDIGSLMKYINGDTEDETDDIISESLLFDYFCRAIRALDETSLNDDNIDSIVNNIIINEDINHKKKLLIALKTMIYAYIAKECQEQIDMNISKLKG